MTWFRGRPPSAAEALELELAGIKTNSPAAGLLPVTDLLRAAALELAPPTALRTRRREVVALGASAALVSQATGQGKRLTRAVLIVLAVATMAAAGVLGVMQVTSWFAVTPSSVSEPVADPDPSADAPDGSTSLPRSSPSEKPGASEPPGAGEQTPATLPDDLNAELQAELLATLRAACGAEETLPDLSGLDETQARALVDALIATCETLATSPIPVETPPVLLDDPSTELQAELLAKLRAACGEEATLPDLTGLDETQARELVDALIAVCEAVPGALLP